MKDSDKPPTIEEIQLEYTASLMQGLNQSHFPKEQQTEIFLKSIAQLNKIMAAERLDELNDTTVPGNFYWNKNGKTMTVHERKVYLQAIINGEKDVQDNTAQA